MTSEKINFSNSKGEKLSAEIAFPVNQKPHNFAVFAHCFTCNKNFRAVRYITQALTAEGFGVMSFDFTGLGMSEGEFADTTFSGSVDDLICAANYLQENYESPAMFIGHSLGGAAALLAASEFEAVKAVVTIGTPSAPQHVKNLLQGGVEEIKEKGSAEVDIGGRNFTVKQQFIDDLEASESFGCRQTNAEIVSCFCIRRKTKSSGSKMPQNFTRRLFTRKVLFLWTAQIIFYRTKKMPVTPEM